MVKILDMQLIRYANLFDQITHIKSNHCFIYNNMIVFSVPRKLVMRAIGRDNLNLRKLSEVIRRRIKIVAEPNGIEDIENFISVIVSPVKFRSIEIKEGEAIISAPTQSKVSLIGRNKFKLLEMENILNQYFGIKKLRIK